MLFLTVFFGVCDGKVAQTACITLETTAITKLPQTVAGLYLLRPPIVLQSTLHAKQHLLAESLTQS